MGKKINYKRFKKFVPVVLFSFMLLVFFIIGVSIFTKSVNSYGKILSSRDWIVLRSNSGQIENILVDNLNGTKNSYYITVFERGDAGKFLLMPTVSINKTVKTYDTIGVVYSNNLEQQITNLKGQIENAKSQLKVNLTGEKESVVIEAQKQIDYAKRQYEDNQKLFTRREELLKKNLISQEEYDLSKNQVEISNLNLSLTKSHLETVRTGVKSETINSIKTNIGSLQNELDVLEKKLTENIILSPLDGIVRISNSSDTLCIVTDTTNYIVMIPVKITDLYLINKKSIKITHQMSREIIEAEIIKTDKAVYPIAGEQYINCIALVKSAETSIMPGMIVSCEIEYKYMTIIDKIKKYFNIL
jgi:hypothetical protein